MGTFIIITIAILAVALLVTLIKAHQYYVRSYDNISPLSFKTIKPFIQIITTDMSLLPPKAFNMLVYSYAIFLILLGLVCITIIKPGVLGIKNF